MSHHNARLTMHGRQLLIEHVRAGCSIAHVAAEMGTAAPPTSRSAAGGPKADKSCTTVPPRGVWPDPPRNQTADLGERVCTVSGVTPDLEAAVDD